MSSTLRTAVAAATSLGSLALTRQLTGLVIAIVVCVKFDLSAAPAAPAPEQQAASEFYFSWLQLNRRDASRKCCSSSPVPNFVCVSGVKESPITIEISLCFCVRVYVCVQIK